MQEKALGIERQGLIGIHMGWLYALFYVILYKGLEHPWILVSVGAPRTNLLQILNSILKMELMIIVLKSGTNDGGTS